MTSHEAPKFSFIRSPLPYLCLLLILAAPLPAKDGGSLRLLVRDDGGHPAVGATAILLELGLRARSDGEGLVFFEDVPAGSHLLEVGEPSLGTSVLPVEIVVGATTDLEVTLTPLRHHDTLVVTASGDPRLEDEVFQPISVIRGRKLARQKEATLGETLDDEAGMSSTWFGPGSSRPVIRGFEGDRVRILENGVDVGDVSSSSPDHAVSSDPLATDRIEIVRGPATLLYASSAIGGVVNVIDDRIPDFLPAAPVTGVAQGLFGTVADTAEGAFSLTGRLGPNGAWHADGFRREAENVDTPEGILGNSGIVSDGGTLGFSYVAEKFWAGASYKGFNSFYGSVAEEDVSVDVQQRRFDVQAGARGLDAPIRGYRFRLGGTDYRHFEMEGDEVGTTFLKDAYEARFEAIHDDGEGWSGTFGIQLNDEDLEAIGEEAFLPPAESFTWAVFSLHELAFGDWKFQAGARYESRDVKAGHGVRETRKQEGISGSVGILRTVDEGFHFSASLSRSVKLPTAEELFSDGPHLATDQFEVGDPDLDEETSLGLDLTFGAHGRDWDVDVNLFWYEFEDYIRLAPTGTIEDGLDVFRFRQSDARFYGAEIHVDADLYHSHPHHLTLEGGVDFVRAEDTDADEDLPRIPPLSANLALEYENERFWAGLQGVWVDEQDHVAPFESATDSYWMLNAWFGYNLAYGNLSHDIVLMGRNLTDELARNHLSFVKEEAPLPGREVSVRYRLTF